MKRAAVVGCPGAGKTVFARKLAAKTGLPLIHLDYYYHQKQHDFYNDKEAWIKKVRQFAQRDKWIIDGNYGSTIEPRFKRADTIIFFDFPRRKSLYGVLKRRVQYHRRQREEMPSDWKEKADWEFLKFVWSFKQTASYRIVAALKDNQHKNIAIFKNRKQAEKYLSEL